MRDLGFLLYLVPTPGLSVKIPADRMVLNIKTALNSSHHFLRLYFQVIPIEFAKTTITFQFKII